MSFNTDGSAATDCTDGFTAGASVCPADLPCAYVHGNGGSCSNAAKTCGKDSDCPDGTCVLGGNSAAGVISCAGGLEGVDLLYTQNSRDGTDPPQCDPNDPDWTPTTGSTPGLCGDSPVLTLSGTGDAGSASLVNTTAIGQVVGSCDAAGPTFCTDTDSIDVRGTPSTLPLITGKADGEMFGINGTTAFCCTDNPPAGVFCDPGQCVWDDFPTYDDFVCSDDSQCQNTLCDCPAGLFSCELGLCAGPLTISGEPLPSCDQLSGESPSLSGGALAGAFTSLSNPTINDIVVTDVLVAK
jgi:hypothetical protein